ncbi:hypothetical protein [Roseibium sediminicola]|uniref:Uncharacterized protein n=1 Tax=Roseibium sediminicola TaxID=2933272 RepID=A0ABT0H2V7_9HYPH|nr:hypothetical protein [Roseibium sp. CAU 1639]MCK7616023.1 hypothetical protein [Roseibium sp. CAU 1639]
MKHDHTIAARIHKAVTDFERQWLSGGHLVEVMVPHLPDLQDLWGRVSDRELRELCLAYPGIHRFAALMEDFSMQDQQMRGSGPHPFQHLGELKEPFRSEAERLLRLASELQAGNGSTEQRINLLYEWKQDVERLLSGDFAGSLPQDVTEVLSKTFETIETRM